MHLDHFIVDKKFPYFEVYKPCHEGGSRLYLSIWEGGDPIVPYCIIVIYLTGTERSKRSVAEMYNLCKFPLGRVKTDLRNVIAAWG